MRRFGLAAFKFQSTPPVSGRRCNKANGASNTNYQFQSTPPVSGRRCAVISLTPIVELLFQSTPPVSGRRCLLLSLYKHKLLEVSIHAPRFREAMR